MLTFISRLPADSFRFTGGTQYGPMAAGVRSIISTPVRLELGASSRRARTREVASKAICTPSARCGKQPVHAIGGGLQPISARSPGPGLRVDAHHPHRLDAPSLRCAFISRSVPMLPGPMMAALIFWLMSSNLTGEARS
jgi:hypothetical protein